MWHLHDWVWHDRNPGQDSRGTAFNSFRNGLLVACPELGWLRDVADAGKHRGLGRLPDVKGAQPQRVASLPLLLNSVLKFYLVLNDGSKQDVDRVLRTAIDFWRTELKAENLPSPFDHPFENT